MDSAKWKGAIHGKTRRRRADSQRRQRSEFTLSCFGLSVPGYQDRVVLPGARMGRSALRLYGRRPTCRALQPMRLLPLTLRGAHRPCRYGGCVQTFPELSSSGDSADRQRPLGGGTWGWVLATCCGDLPGSGQRPRKAAASVWTTQTTSPSSALMEATGTFQGQITEAKPVATTHEGHHPGALWCPPGQLRDVQGTAPFTGRIVRRQ